MADATADATTAAVCPACGHPTRVPVRGLTPRTAVACAGPACWLAFRPLDDPADYAVYRGRLALAPEAPGA